MIAYLRLFFYAFCCLTFPLLAADEPAPLKFQILSEMAAVQSGKNFSVALRMELQPKWHAYWKNPGDAGAPPRVTWTLPDGFEVVDLQWPIPERFSTEGLVTFGYKDEVVLLATLKAPLTFNAQQPVDIGADLQWVVCSEDTCLPGSSQANFKIGSSGTAIPQANTEAQALIRKAREKLPQQPAESSASHQSGVIEFVIHLPEGAPKAYTSAYFCPENPDMIDSRSELTLTPSKAEPNHYTVVMREMDATASVKNTALKGVLVMNNGQRTDGWEIEVPLLNNHPTDEIISMADVPTSIGVYKDVIVVQNEVSSFGVALLFALIGGMILNLMPCVLPIISIKILSFVQMAGQKRALILQHGLVFSLGVLVSFWILAGMLLGLQSYGASVGWGFQLQEPLFVAILAALLLVFAVSMFGVFEMGSFFASWAGHAHGKVHKEGYVASFFSGVLATAVATPCTGPFLGSAVGYAVTLDAWQAMSIFTFVGLGMALPYLFLSAFPKFLRWLPRPGKWMDTFKQLMGFLMLAAVLWLVWVFGGQTNSMSLMMFLVGLFLLTFACWVYGTWGMPMSRKPIRYTGRTMALLIALMSGMVIYTSVALGTPDSPTDSTTALVADGWEPYSPERIAELQKQGTPVFIDFTAKWCLICQANHMILGTQKVEANFNKKGVVRMKADWTRNDPRITEALRAHGRNSVPLYLLYPGAEGGKPQVLPQVLTPEVVVDHLNKLS